jgi:hypothetical protein
MASKVTSSTYKYMETYRTRSALDITSMIKRRSSVVACTAPAVMPREAISRAEHSPSTTTVRASL